MLTVQNHFGPIEGQGIVSKYFKLAILGQQQGSVYIARSGGPGVPGGVPGGGQPVAINLSNNQTLNLSKAGNPGGASLSAAKITGTYFLLILLSLAKIFLAKLKYFSLIK